MGQGSLVLTWADKGPPYSGAQVQLLTCELPLSSTRLDDNRFWPKFLFAFPSAAIAWWFLRFWLDPWPVWGIQEAALWIFRKTAV